MSISYSTGAMTATESIGGPIDVGSLKNSSKNVYDWDGPWHVPEVLKASAATLSHICLADGSTVASKLSALKSHEVPSYMTLSATDYCTFDKATAAWPFTKECLVARALGCSRDHVGSYLSTFETAQEYILVMNSAAPAPDDTVSGIIDKQVPSSGHLRADNGGSVHASRPGLTCIDGKAVWGFDFHCRPYYVVIRSPKPATPTRKRKRFDADIESRLKSDPTKSFRHLIHRYLHGCDLALTMLKDDKLPIQRGALAVYRHLKRKNASQLTLDMFTGPFLDWAAKLGDANAVAFMQTSHLINVDVRGDDDESILDFGNSKSNKSVLIEAQLGCCANPFGDCPFRDEGYDSLPSACDVDHIKRKADGGPDIDSNRWVLCCQCHAKKTRLEPSGAWQEMMQKAGGFAKMKKTCIAAIHAAGCV